MIFIMKIAWTWSYDIVHFQVVEVSDFWVNFEELLKLLQASDSLYLSDRGIGLLLMNSIIEQCPYLFWLIGIHEIWLWFKHLGIFISPDDWVKSISLRKQVCLGKDQTDTNQIWRKWLRKLDCLCYLILWNGEGSMHLIECNW